MIVAKNIRKSFDGKKILKDVDLTVKPGEITVVIGPSGTGKTTLLRALALLENPDFGTVSVDEMDYSFPLKEGQTITPPWPEMTVVFQSLFLWPHLTLRENILMPARNVDAVTADARLEKLIETFGVRHFIDNYPNEASLGQRQRVALIRALMLKPKYILLDEITSALDVEQVAKVLKHLQELRDEGIGIFIITHLIGFARRAADNIVFMSDGTVVEQGPPAILDNPKSQRLKDFVSVIEQAQ